MATGGLCMGRRVRNLYNRKKQVTGRACFGMFRPVALK